MNTWLYLTAEGLTTLSVDWPCCVWSSTGERQLMPLHQAAQAVSGQAVDILLPMEMCSWVRSEPWPSRRHPGQHAIAFAVEDQLSETLENLHLSIGTRDPQGCFPVMATSREPLADVLALLVAAGITARSVFVDADVLPATVAVRWFGRWLLGGDIPVRVALSDPELAMLESALPADLQRLDERDRDVDIDSFLKNQPVHAINLLQGEFAVRTRRLPWRIVGLALLMLLLLSWSAAQTRIGFLEDETRRLYAQSEQQFKALYPDEQRIVDLAAQLRVLQSQAQPANTRVADLVTLIERVVGASQVDIQRIEYRAGDGWKIQLTANSFAELEQLRERGRQQGVPLRFDSASKAGAGVQATLTVEEGA